MSAPSRRSHFGVSPREAKANTSPSATVSQLARLSWLLCKVKPGSGFSVEQEPGPVVPAEKDLTVAGWKTLVFLRDAVSNEPPRPFRGVAALLKQRRYSNRPSQSLSLQNHPHTYFTSLSTSGSFLSPPQPLKGACQLDQPEDSSSFRKEHLSAGAAGAQV